MAITHFEIKELPDPNFVISKIGVSPLLVDTLYPIAQQSSLNFERHSDLDGLYCAEVVVWKTHNDVAPAESNQAVGQLIWKTTNAGLDALSANATQLIAKATTVRLIDLLPINEATEFIQVTSFSGALNYKLNGTPLAIGQKISVQDLVYSTFTSNVEGGGDPYAVLTYEVGKHNILEGTSYTLTIDVDSLGELNESVAESLLEYSDDFDVPPVTAYNVKEQNLEIQITEGSQNGTAEMEFIIASPFLALNTWNRVFITYGSTVIEKSADETFLIDVPLDVNGQATIGIRNYIAEDTVAAKTGQLDMTLKKINTDSGLVSLTNFTVQLLTSY